MSCWLAFRIGNIAIAPLMMAASPVAPQENLANYILILGSIASVDPAGHLKMHDLTPADLETAQRCKDAVQAGKKFSSIPGQDEPPPAPPGLINPKLQDHVQMMNRCILAAGIEDVVVSVMPTGVRHPQLK